MSMVSDIRLKVSAAGLGAFAGEPPGLSSRIRQRRKGRKTGAVAESPSLATNKQADPAGPAWISLKLPGVAIYSLMPPGNGIR